MIKSFLSCQLRSLRKAAKLTQEEVAGILNIERQTYCNYENDSRTPPLETIIFLADFYHVTVDYMVREDASGASDRSDALLPDEAEKEIIRSYRSLPSQSRQEVIQFIRFKSILSSEKVKK